MKILGPQNSWSPSLGLHNLILGAIILTLTPVIAFIARATRHKVYTVQVRPVHNEEAEFKKDIASTHRSTRNTILLKNIRSHDLKELNKLIHGLCRLGFKVVLSKEDISGIDNHLETLSSKCVDIVENVSLSNNEYIVSDVESIKHILKVIEKIEEFSMPKLNEVNKVKDVNNRKIDAIANNITDKVVKPAIPKDLYTKLKHGISEKELNKLPDEYKLLIKVLRDEGLVYVERGGVYKLVSKHLDLPL